MNPKKAFRKFGQAAIDAPPGASLTVGLMWIEPKGWRVMMMIHTSVLHLDAKETRALAVTYDKHHQSPGWRGIPTGLEWVAPALRSLADEADQKNRDHVMPPEMLEHIAPHGHS